MVSMEIQIMEFRSVAFARYYNTLYNSFTPRLIRAFTICISQCFLLAYREEQRKNCLYLFYVYFGVSMLKPLEYTDSNLFDILLTQHSRLTKTKPP